MKLIVRYIIITLLFALNMQTANAQLVVTPGLTPTQLAKLIAGQGVSVYNVKYTGSPNAEGSFGASTTNLGLNSGLILSTGDITDAIGPNDTSNAGQDLMLPGDLDLENLTGIITNDAAVLEFDFIPQSDSVSFRYVFASEEYPEFVCSNFNDVFGFFISGPGIVGAPNIALIPGGSNPVAINTVNNGSVGASVGTPVATCGLGDSAYYVDNTNGPGIQYDAFTTVFVAKSKVQRCEIYHMKIAIADGTDGWLDSGVFLEAGSLFSTPIVEAGNDAAFCKDANNVLLGGPQTAGWTYSWTPATGLSDINIANPTLTISNATSSQVIYYYAVSATDGTCTLHDTVEITLNPIPSSAFISSVTACSRQPFNVIYTGGAIPAATYNWNFNGAGITTGTGQGPYLLTYPSKSNLPISLTVIQYGCPSTTTYDTVPILETPVSSFASPAGVCTNELLNVNFTGTGGAAATFNWNFGGGSVVSGSGSGPYQLKYPTGQTATITLIVRENNCQDTSKADVVVTNYPVASFALPPVTCTDNSVNVFFNGTVGPAATYNWNFGNAQIAGGSGAGPYNVSWTTQQRDSVKMIVSDNGCRDTIQNYINVWQQPVATLIDPTSICAESVAPIFFNGIAANTSVFTWNFGTNNTVSGSGNSYDVIYHNAGVQYLSVDVNNNGCRDIFYDTITVYPKPVAAFSVANICEDIPVSFNNISSGNGGTLNNYHWDFGDSTPASVDSAASHVFADFGSYDVQLYVITTDACRDTIEHTINIFEKPLADFTTDTVCLDAVTHLKDLSSVQTSTINSWKWMTGTGDSLIAFPMNFTYPIAGSINSSLIVKTVQGCYDTVQHPVRIWNLPVADFTTVNPDGCTPVMTEFKDKSTSADGIVTHWLYDFGDHFKDSINNTSHLYIEPGTYDVKLAVTSNYGCADDTTVLRAIEIYANPVANFRYAPETPDMFMTDIFFDNRSERADYNAWTFGDGKLSDDVNPVHHYKNPGTYTITLIVTTDDGCADTLSEIILIKDVYAIYVPNAFTPDGDGINDVWQIMGTGLQDMQYYLYNRWGELIFSGDLAHNSWDGTFKNTESPQGTYVYKIRVKDILQKTHDIAGRVTLIR